LEALAAYRVGSEAGAAGEDAGDLADAVGAVVEVDDDIVIADWADGMAFGIDAGKGRDELIGDAVVVELFDSGDGVGVGPAFGMAGDHGVEGLPFLLPAQVAVHSVVAAAYGGDLAGPLFAEGLLEGFHVAEAAGGHGVASVHEGMDEDVGELVLGGHANECVEVALVRVDAAVGEQSDEMERSSLLACQFVGTDQRGVGVEAAVHDGGVDACHVHSDDAAGAEVEVTDLGVAHLTVWQADEVFAGAQEGVGVVLEEAVVDGLAGLGDGVAVGLEAIAPAVEDGENDGFGHA